jgi:hypothetical protein
LNCTTASSVTGSSRPVSRRFDLIADEFDKKLVKQPLDDGPRIAFSSTLARAIRMRPLHKRPPGERQLTRIRFRIAAFPFVMASSK